VQNSFAIKKPSIYATLTPPRLAYQQGCW